MPIIIEEIRIDRIRYGDRKGQYEGSVSFTDTESPTKLSISLNDDEVRDIFTVCANNLINTSRVYANALTSNTIDQKVSFLSQIKAKVGIT